MKNKDGGNYVVIINGNWSTLSCEVHEKKVYNHWYNYV